MRWVEANIGVTGNVDAMHEVLLDFVIPFVGKMRNKFTSWHFLWESKPWSITLRLRFYGEEDIVEKIKQEIENKLNELEKNRPELYLGHCFGSHGDCGKDYEGEAAEWGTEAWNLGIKFLNLGSEVALTLLKNKGKLGSSEEYKKSIEFYADRFVHCFLNNIFDSSKEINFYLEQAIQRTSYSYTKKLFEQSELQNFINEIRGLIVQKAKNYFHEQDV